MREEGYIRANTRQRYPDGSFYRLLRPRQAGDTTCRHPGEGIAVNLNLLDISWPEFWRRAQEKLRTLGYSGGTLRLYRQVLRQFAADTGVRPLQVTPEDVGEYLGTLADRRRSWSWLSTNISSLRTMLDKVGGLAVVERFKTPRRRLRLPVILSTSEIARLLEKAVTLRDQLLLGLLYGCGLRAGEACSLRWADVDTKEGFLAVGGGGKRRTLPLPEVLRPVLSEGISRCASEEFVFPGAREGTHLSTRMALIICRKAAAAADIVKPVTCMTLRHSYAVHCLEGGATIREVQDALGHERIETTLLYQRCILPGQPGNTAFAGSPLTEDMLPISGVPDKVDLPFGRDSLTGSQEFLQILKLRVGGRLLALRTAIHRRGRPARGS